MSERTEVRTGEEALAVDLLQACKRWLAAQRLEQAEDWPRIMEALCSAAEIRFEVSVTPGAWFTNLRCVTLDGEGREKVLLRSLNLAPTDE